MYASSSECYKKQWLPATTGNWALLLFSDIYNLSNYFWYYFGVVDFAVSSVCHAGIVNPEYNTQSLNAVTIKVDINNANSGLTPQATLPY